MPIHSRARRGGLLLATAVLASACARPGPAPPADVVERARAAASYSARLRVSLAGPELRARTSVLIGFRRPDGLRVEVPGPTGARLIAVTREGSIVAVFPGERAYFEGPATPEELAHLLGVALAPGEVMDLLTGQAPARVRDYRVRWGKALPERLEATLPDGGRLKATVEEAELAAELPAAAFAPPSHEGYRRVAAAEARALWSGR